MYLSRIHIQDFRILKDIKLRFQPPVGKSDGNNGNVVNVIAGVNGCGKTTLLDHYNLYSTQAFNLGLCLSNAV